MHKKLELKKRSNRVNKKRQNKKSHTNVFKHG